MKTKKAILRLIVLLGLLVGLIVPAAAANAADAAVTLSIPASVTAGSNFTVTVNVDSVTNFDAAQYDITYDNTKIEVQNLATDITAGSIGGTAIPIAMVKSMVAGRIRIINNVSGYAGVNGGGTLASIVFKAVGSAGQSSSISFVTANCLLGDTDPKAIPATWTGGTVNIASALTASFTPTTASPAEALVNQNVTFTATASGGSGTKSYDWDFDNNGSTDNNTASNVITHKYGSAATYSVKLTVTDDSGSFSVTNDNCVIVYSALIASASANITEAATGESIKFTGSATGGKAGYTYAWDLDGDGFDDGTGAELDHVFDVASAPSSLTIRVQATDSLGNTAIGSVDVTIYARGDADKSGAVDSADITYIEHIIMEDATYLQTSWADANHDFKWDILDITATEKIIVP
jgi:PKD repeat protein